MSVFLHYLEYTLALDAVDNKLGRFCLRWNTTNKVDHSAVAGEDLNNRMKLNVGRLLGVGAFSSVCGIVYVLLSSYETRALY